MNIQQTLSTQFIVSERQNILQKQNNEMVFTLEMMKII